jgi:hypothetical protein
VADDDAHPLPKALGDEPLDERAVRELLARAQA